MSSNIANSLARLRLLYEKDMRYSCGHPSCTDENDINICFRFLCQHVTSLTLKTSNLCCIARYISAEWIWRSNREWASKLSLMFNSGARSFSTESSTLTVYQGMQELWWVSYSPTFLLPYLLNMYQRTQNLPLLVIRRCCVTCAYTVTFLRAGAVAVFRANVAASYLFCSMLQGKTGICWISASLTNL